MVCWCVGVVDVAVVVLVLVVVAAMSNKPHFFIKGVEGEERYSLVCEFQLRPFGKTFVTPL